MKDRLAGGAAGMVRCAVRAAFSGAIEARQTRPAEFVPPAAAQAGTLQRVLSANPRGFRRFLASLALAGICSAVSFASAENALVDDDDDELTLLITSEVIQRFAEAARQSNPALLSAQARTRAAEANVDSIRTWEDPMGMIGVMGARRMMRSEDGDIIYGLQQELPLFGRPGLARDVARAETDTRKADEEFTFQELRRAIAGALYDAALADRIIEITEQDINRLDTLISVVEQRYRIGDATQMDVLRAKTERAQRATRLENEINNRSHTRYALNRLLNLRTLWPFLRLPALAEPVEYSQELVQLAQQNEPQLRILMQEAREADAMVQMTRRERLPEVNVGLEGRTYSGDRSFRQGMAFLSFSIPWGNRARYQSAIDRDEARAAAVEMDVTDRHLEILERIHHLTIEIDAARREALLYRDEVIPRTEQVLAGERVAWESAEGTFVFLLEADRMLLDAQLMYARAVAEQHKMISELLLWTGQRDLEALRAGLKAAPDPAGEQNH